MAVKYRRRNKRKSNTGRRRKRNVVTLSRKQARSSKYDSKIEKVMARVARKEDQKRIEKLQYRQYLFGPYDMTTNTFGGNGYSLSFTGVVAPLAQLQLTDNETVVTQVPAQNPLQNPQTWIPPGQNVIGPDISRDGSRRGYNVRVQGIKVGIRASLAAVSAIGAPLFDSATVHYKIVSVMYDGSTLADSKPTAAQTGTMIPLFGKSHKLDKLQFATIKNTKVRTHFKGSLKLRVNTLNSDVKFRSHFVNFSKKALKIMYREGDQSGRYVERWKPFIVFQSDIPSAAGYDDYKPKIWATTTLIYTDCC